MREDLSGRVFQYAAAVAALRGDQGGSDGSSLNATIARVFEPTREITLQFAEIADSIASLDELRRCALEILAPIRSFHAAIRSLADEFESMRKFLDALGIMAQDFEPLRGLHQQLSQLGPAFHDNLADFAQALEPLEAIQRALAAMVRDFEAIGDLREEFCAISEMFLVPEADTDAFDARDLDVQGIGAS